MCFLSLLGGKSGSFEDAAMQAVGRNGTALSGPGMKVVAVEAGGGGASARQWMPAHEAVDVDTKGSGCGHERQWMSDGEAVDVGRRGTMVILHRARLTRRLPLPSERRGQGWGNTLPPVLRERHSED